MRTWAFCLLPAAACGVTWQFDRPEDLESAHHLRDVVCADGWLRGLTQWDPFVYLTLPERELDVSDLTRLTVRLYSTGPADALGVYYQSNDGRWALGHAMPIVPGLAEYRVDLTRLGYGNDVSPGEGVRQWGGVTKQVIMFRIDPGNQEGRWIAFDEVTLAPADAAPFEPGVTVLSRPGGRLVAVETPAEVVAGTPVDITVRVDVGADVTPSEDELVVWLCSGDRVWADRVTPVRLAPGEQAWQVRIPTLTYAQPVELGVRVGLLRSTVAGAGFAVEPGRLRVVNPRAGTARPPEVSIRPLGGDPTLFIDGGPVAASFLVVHGANLDALHREFGAAGVHLFADWFGGSYASDLGHVAPDTYDYSEFDTYFARALEADPEAYFLPHIGITPPMWWQQAYPEELCLYADGGRGPQSFASERWRRETAEDLRKLLAHLYAAPYADRLLGFNVFSGYSAEWQSWGLWQDHLADYSAPAQRAWEAWYRGRHGDGPVPPMPTPEQRHRGAHGFLRDATAEAVVIDYYQFLADLTAEAITYFCGVVKDATDRRALCGTYYGYLTEHGVRQQDSSHLALRRVLASPDVDFLMSPPLYTDRALAEAGGFMSATESVRLAGKLWISEADYRTHLSAPSSGYGRVGTPAETTAVLWREMANVLTRRVGVWWFDMTGTWLLDPAIAAQIGAMRRVQEDALQDREPFAGEVAAVVDERSFIYATAMHPLGAQMVLQALTALPRVGVSWDFYLLDDIVSGAAPPHRVYLFLNALRIDEKQRAALLARFEREGATAIWQVAPGYYGDAAVGPEAMEALCGFALRQASPAGPLQAVDPQTGQLVAGSDVPSTPVFVAVQPDAETLGVLPAGDGVALARRRVGGWTSVFSSAPHLTPEMLRRLAADAGCHLYLESGDPLFVDNRFVGIHAAGDGVKTVRLPAARRIRDAVDGRVLADSASEVTLRMSRGETRLLRLD